MKILLNNPQIRQISYKKILTWYASLSKPKKTEPPYNHIVQIGDPNLRTVADRVPEELINSPEINFLIKRMKSVFYKYQCVGLSANQLGFPLQLFLIEFNKSHASEYTEKEQKSREMNLLPFTVVINPELKVNDYKTLKFHESCGSIRGMAAEVPRYRSVQLKGLNEHGKSITIDAIGWTARIIQHEIDHLNGKVYTDIMDRKTLTCSCWHVINERNGKVELPYGPG